MDIINHQFRLAARPVGLPKPSDWTYTQETIHDVKEGEILVKLLYISVDPAMRGWMKEGKSYIDPVNIGDVMRAGGLGRVVASKNAKFAVGDTVSGQFGVQEYVLSDGKQVSKIDPKLAPLPIYLSALGMVGMTAYFGLLEVGQPKSGETVVVSGAAGATGSLVGQIAKIKGCRVIGIAGGAEKCQYITQTLGFDAAIDYKTEEVKRALKKHCSKGIDIYFDNVGGDILDDALSQIALHARVVLCGAISQYNNTDSIKGPANYLSLLFSRAKMQGFIVFDYVQHFSEAISNMAAWLAAGKLKSHEDIVEGIESFPETLLKLFKGENLGKLMIKVSES
jgi:NADPH-dependent curcumin reductase CurA